MPTKIKFVHWMISAFPDIPSEPMFDVTTEIIKHSTVSGGTVLKVYQMPLPLFPSLQTWQRETRAKRKCFRCWATTKGFTDWMRHREVVHHEKIYFTPSSKPLGTSHQGESQ